MFSKKILCLGNNTQDTDHKVNDLATSVNATNFGIISDANFVPAFAGYYHTTILDLTFGNIVNIAKYFDNIVMLDQPQEEWTHWKPLLSTYKIMLELEKLGYNTEFKTNKNIEKFTFFDDLLKTNKSFCIHPWMNFVNYGDNIKLCARSSKTVTTISKLGDWQTNQEYNEIRQKMLRGELLHEECKVCYEYEKNGMDSYRTYETKDWVGKLDINTVDDLNNISHPYYYEIRLNNKCNIMCRGCRPMHSHLIEREFKKFNIIMAEPQVFEYSSLDVVNIETLSPKVRVYLTGGEPTIIADVYKFMQSCIDAGKTDFDFTIGTNAEKLSDKFLNLTRHFTNMNFSISLDGFGKVNDYWRWGSNWDNVINNTKKLQSLGHNISVNCVPGIYNVTNLHLMYEFLDKEFPNVTVYSQINNRSEQSPFNHPNTKMCVESMERCKQTGIYYSDGKSNKSVIDSLHKHYNNNPQCNVEELKKFFEFNDKLDKIRGSRLGDYIPELEDCRKYIS